MFSCQKQYIFEGAGAVFWLAWLSISSHCLTQRALHPRWQKIWCKKATVNELISTLHYEKFRAFTSD